MYTYDQPNMVGTNPVYGRSHASKRKQLMIRNPMDNSDIKGSQIDWNKYKGKDYNPMDYSDVSKITSERKIRGPNVH
jgi:hypothetical protein